MQVKEVMTASPACCTPDTPLPEVARMMVDNDCGEIPVVNNKESKIPVGVVTDRDIVCRTIAKDRNPLDLTAADCMSKPIVTVSPRSRWKSAVASWKKSRLDACRSLMLTAPSAESSRSLTLRFRQETASRDKWLRKYPSPASQHRRQLVSLRKPRFKKGAEE